VVLDSEGEESIVKERENYCTCKKKEG